MASTTPFKRLLLGTALAFGLIAAAHAKITGLPLAVHVEVAKDTHLSPVIIDDSVISGLRPLSCC